MKTFSSCYFLFLISMPTSVIGYPYNRSICQTCSCFDNEVNCRNLKLTQCFEAVAWPVTGNFQFFEANFDNNHIGHVTKFPPVGLVKLSFKNNRLVKIDDRAFEELTHLEELDLSINELTSINLLPAVFEGLYDPSYYEPLKLKILDLSANELHTLHPDLFEHLPHLERLYLKQNPFKILDKPTVIAISSLPKLEILDLSYTKIKELPDGFLHTPKNLMELVLKGNSFTEIPDFVLVESQNLQILNFNENPITFLSGEKPFPEMPTLKQLHISFMPNLTRIEARSLSGLQNLDYLYCRMNENLAYISPDAFARNDSERKFPNLLKLDISDNALRYIEEDLVKPMWKSLKSVNIVGNPISCDCENQWIVSELVPFLQNISSPVDALICYEPSAMKGQHLTSLHIKNHSMRCLDMYGNHPENDGPILISIFIIIILLLIIILGAIVWAKNNNTCRQGSRINYHRAFYKPTSQEDSDKY